MAYSKLEHKIFEMAKPIVEDMDCYVYDVEYVKEGKSRFLRIFADKDDGGISLDECEAISRKVSDALDEADPIRENYCLEISSPGIERRLRNPEHFERYLGRLIEVGFFKAVDGKKSVLGTLTAYKDGEITIDAESQKMSFVQSETAYAKLHFEF